MTLEKRRKKVRWTLPCAVLLVAWALLAPPPAHGQDKPADQAAPAAAEAPKFADLDAIRGALDGAERAAAVDRLWRMALTGDAAAQILYGDLHMRGTGVVQNYSLAGVWYRKAADKGDAEAQYKLAGLYAEGFGVPRTLKQAENWLIKAAEQGHAMALADLGKMGVEPPPPKEKKEKRKRKKKDQAAAAAAAVPRMDVRLVGMGPAAAMSDPAALELARRFIGAVNDNDLETLKALTGPEYAACANDRNRKVYEDFLAAGLEHDIPNAHTLLMGAAGPPETLPFGDLLSFPVVPGHYMKIVAAGPAPAKDAMRVLLSPAFIQFLANTDGKWSLVFGCPTAAGVERLRRARDGKG